MAKNLSGTYVHVHLEGGGTAVVAPDEDFPDGATYDESLTRAPGSEETVEVAGPSQRAITLAPSGPEEWKDVTVPQLREGLTGREGVVIESTDRKDALVEKAVAAGLTPADFRA